MKTSYLQGKIEKQQLINIVDNVLALAKRAGMSAAEASLSQETGFAVTVRAGDVETLEHHQAQNLVITVFDHKRTGSASTSDVSDKALADAVEKACAFARYAGEDDCAGLADKDSLAFVYPDLDLYHHWSITPAEAIQAAIECESVALEQDKRILHCDSADISTYDKFLVYGNSLGFLGHLQASYHSASCSLVAQLEQQMQRDGEYTVARRPDRLDDFALLAKHAAQKTVQRLGARRIKTQQCPVVFHAPEARGLLSAFVNAISGGNLYRGASFLLDQLHKPVFPAHISIFQQPHLLAGIGSAPFDSDGVKTQEQHYVRDGILCNYVLGSYSARKLQLATTGNAGGVYNLSVTHSDDNLAALLKKMHQGLLVTDLMGQGTNILTGNYSRGASGFWVEQGEIQFPVEEITIASNLADMFQGMIAVANDVDRRGNIHTGSILIDKMMVAGE